MKWVARAVVCAVCVPLAVAAQAPPPVEQLRERATGYVAQFIARFSGVVAEERLVQETTSLPSVSGSGLDRKIESPTPQRREIRSDFLFIRRAATDDWHVYRDAFEVNGRAVRDRGDRLMKLLTAPSLTNEQMALRVAQESSRYSLSPGLRSVDDPVLVLVFLQPNYHPRFRFTRGPRDRVLGADVWVVNYQEQVRPTVVRGLGEADAPSHGRVWIDAATGRVLKTDLQVRSSQIETTFTWDEALGVAVPAEMHDSYSVGGTNIRATASYSRFRRFDVSTSEQVGETVNRRVIGITAAVLGAVAAAAAQAPSVAPLPTFQSQVTYVELVVSVTGADGGFVPGLGKADFEVLDDSQPQNVESLAMVDLAAERAAAGEPLAEPDVRSNERPFAGRVWVLALDAINTPPDRTPNVRQIARLFVERALGPDDLMAIVTLGDAAGAYHDLTNNRQRLLQALEGFTGESIEPMVVPPDTTRGPVPLPSPLSGPPGTGEQRVASLELARQESALKVMRKLRTVADWAASVHGRRKAIVWLSEGIAHDVTSEFSSDRLDASGLAVTSVGLEIRDTAGVITRADVNIYAIDTAGLTVESALKDPVRWLGQLNLRLMAESTGGFALTNSNNYGAAFDRVVRENSAYYVLTYSPPDARRNDGRYHRIRVRVKRPGVTVRTREGYLAPRARVEPAPPLVTAAGLSPQLRDVMQSPLPVSGLPVRASAVPFRGQDGRASVLLTGELPAGAFGGGEVPLEVSYAAIDATPAVRGSQTLRSTLAAGSPLLAQARRSGIAFARRLELTPGRYQLRVGARDAARNVSGSVLYDLDVPDFAADTLAMSGIVLGVTRGGQPAMARDEPIESALGAAPVTRRQLSAADGEAVIHVEIYDSEPQPHAVTLSASLQGVSGPPAFADREERRSQDADTGGVHRYTVQIPLAAVPAGNYVLTVDARSRASGRSVQRRVPLTVVSTAR